MFLCKVSLKKIYTKDISIAIQTYNHVHKIKHDYTRYIIWKYKRMFSYKYWFDM